MAQVVLPALERFREGGASFVDVVVELLSWTVEQHLRTAWSRLAVDPRKDVSLLLVDGNRWAYRKAFRPGQTASRLEQVDQWLRHLGVLDDGGLTPEGHRLLDERKAALGLGVSA